MRVLTIGAGGHGQVVADAILSMRAAGSDVEPIGYLDGDPALAGQLLLDVPVLGGMARLGAVSHDAVVVAIGDHAHVGPGAHLAGGVAVGDGALVGIGAAVLPRCRLGPWSVVSAGAVVNSDVAGRALAVGVPARTVGRNG